MAIDVRRATYGDFGTLVGLIDALADYERLPRPTEEARERLLRDGWPHSGKPRFQAWVATEELEGSKKAVGYAITFETYSSFLARPTLYIEDVFVLPERRRAGVGSALFDQLVNEATKAGCGRVEWVVLDWNTGAQEFYIKMGARHLEDWRHFRLAIDQGDSAVTAPSAAPE